jgi:hypothetical protein
VPRRRLAPKFWPFYPLFFNRLLKPSKSSSSDPSTQPGAGMMRSTQQVRASEGYRLWHGRQTGASISSHLNCRRQDARPLSKSTPQPPSAENMGSACNFLTHFALQIPTLNPQHRPS